MFHVEPKHSFTLLANTKDYLVTGTSFEVRLDQQTQIAYTYPQPKETELAQYYASEEYISHGNKKRSAIERVYAAVQKIMLKQKKQWLTKQLKQKKRYLDFGCGTASLVAYLNSKNWDAYGVEPSEKARNFSTVEERLYPSLEELPQSDFDAIALWHVLEHLSDPAKFLKAFYDRLDQQGHLFLALPNFNSYDAKHYGNFWAAYDVPRHLWHFSAKGIIELCEANGFTFVESKGLGFDAFYVSYLSEQHKKSKFAFIKGMMVGCWSNLLALFTQEYSSKLYVFKKKV